MPEITQDWSLGPMGPGWLIMFPANVQVGPGGGGSGSGSHADHHTFQRGKSFPDAVVAARLFDDDEAIALVLLEL